jgi:ubiquitin
MPRKKDARKKKTSKGSDTAVSLADLESAIVHESLSKNEFAPLASPCSIHIHSKRKRLTDADGVSAKAAIDGTVHGGLLQDDSPEFVQEVSYSQAKAKDEETIIEFWIEE